MSGVATGQVFSEDELDRILGWYTGAFDQPDWRVSQDDWALCQKIQAYFDQVACRVPR